MANVYEQHDSAFRNISAFAVLKGGEHVANITLKHGGAVTAFVHWIGVEMRRGRAGGGGYDRATSAIEGAASKMPLGLDAETGCRADPRHDYNDFRRALVHDDGAGWSRHLERAGFTICNVIT